MLQMNRELVEHRREATPEQWEKDHPNGNAAEYNEDDES
jgi:hypothetical protein